MSEHKRAGMVASVNSGMTIAASHNRLRHHFRIKLLTLSFAGILVVAGVCFFIYHRYHSGTQTPHKVVAQQAEPVPGFTSFTPDQKAQYYVLQKNYVAADATYKSELSTASTKSAKANIYLALGTTDLTASNYGQAYEDGVQADNLDPSYSTAQFVGYAAQMNNDDKDAVKYYQLAIDRLSTSTPTYEYIHNSLESDLKGVTQ